jgi:hypothetical protein
VAAAAVAGWDLRRRAGGLGDPGLGQAIARIGVASGLMAGLVAVVSVAVPGSRGLALAARVVAAVGIGVVTYVVAARALGMDELTALLRQLRRRSA